MLSGRIGAGDILGVQSNPVHADVKQSGLYDQEGRRVSVNEQVDERTLHEYYLRNWEIAIRRADPGSVMCAFSKNNGVNACDTHSGWGASSRLRAL